jgi:hypothetical protein
MLKFAKLIGFFCCMAFLVSACGPAPTEPPATEAPSTTEPVVTEVPAVTEEPVVTESPVVTGEPVETNYAAILVVDNFPPSEASLSATPTSNPTSTPSSEEPVCRITPDGFGKYGGQESAITILGKPHGIYVYNQVIHEIQQAGFQPIDPGTGLGEYDVADFDGVDLTGTGGSLLQDYAYIRRIDHWQANGNNLVVVAVDTEGLDLSAIVSYIPAVVNLFRNKPVLAEDDPLPPISHFVVNMSFGFVPCDTLEYIRPSLRVLSDELGLDLCEDDECTNVEALSDLQDHEKLIDYINSPESYDDIDPVWASIEQTLQTRIETHLAGEPTQWDAAKLAAFAAHLVYSPNELGQAGGNYATFLAENSAWLTPIEEEFTDLLDKYPDVVFVGAAGNSGFSYPFLPAALDSVISVSSLGAALSESCQESKAVDSNCGEIKLGGEFTPQPNITGTSFAAPKLSYLVAVHLLSGGSGTECTLPDGNVIHPVIGYSGGNGPWNNLTVEQVTNICPDFTR